MRDVADSSLRDPVRARRILAVVFSLGSLLMALFAVALTVNLAGMRPHSGYWYAGVAAGAVIAISVPALSLRDLGKVRWRFLLFMVSLGAVVVGTRVFTIVNIVRAVQRPRPAPSPGAVLVTLAMAFTATGLALAAFGFLVGLAYVVAPGPFRRAGLRWRGRQARRHPATAVPTGRASRVPRTMPVRLQLPGHENQPWLRGNVQVAPGRLAWIPSAGAGAAPVELTQATLIPGRPATRRSSSGTRSKVITVRTDAGEIRLTMGPGQFQLAQEAATQPWTPA